MSTSLVSILDSRYQKILDIKEKVEHDLRNGYIIEQVPETELSFWFKILRFISHILCFDLTPPKQKRFLSEIDREHLQKKVEEFNNILSQINDNIIQIKKIPELKTIPTGLTDRDDGYPDDWEKISLDYRRRIGFICENCGAYAPDGHVHHDISVSKGGSSNDNNLIFLCKDCHKQQHPHMEK
jgi:hypothetical protein